MVRKAASMDEATYQAAIPPCCEFQTVDEHVRMLGLCWGLTAAIEGKREMNCGTCECATRKVDTAPTHQPAPQTSAKEGEASA